VFAEPQFEPRLAQLVVEDSGAKLGVLDPLGAGISDGPGLYFELMRRDASALRDCLQVHG
ncbi:MAG TPA: zinc ABC transporter substrate-binding protein, partial [Alphaproteobacteria bacterium]|nr:zinc ABC transporter substrate-binding protein [Alphaproteobacteria bacterium]